MMKKVLIGFACPVIAAAMVLAARRPKTEAPRAQISAVMSAVSREGPPRAGTRAAPTRGRPLQAGPPRVAPGDEPLPDTVPRWAEAAFTRRAFGDPDGVEKYSYGLGLYAFLDA
jgi:hypothetical protein